MVDRLVAVVPLCQTKCKWVRGHLCVVLTTDFPSDRVSLDDVTNVIDPLNWSKCLPFFCEMDPYPLCGDGWSRVLEHVSETCPIPGTQMVTPLKYFKGQQLAELTAWIDYQLDDQPAAGEKGDGRMVVDEGFIRMRSTAGNSAADGVRVRTRKFAGFRNLAYVPAAIFACVMGYGDQGVAMVLDGVANRAQAGGVDWTPWQPSMLVAHADPQPPPGDTKATDSGDPSRRAVTLAVDMLNECIDDMSKKSAAIAAKWATGVVPIAESMSFSSDMAVRLATDPWRYLERLRNPTPGSDK